MAQSELYFGCQSVDVFRKGKAIFSRTEEAREERVSKTESDEFDICGRIVTVMSVSVPKPAL
jgi:hypothetical protein